MAAGAALALPGSALAAGSSAVVGHVYLNDNPAGANTIAGFARHADGSLTALSGSPFAAGGTGAGHGLGSRGAQRRLSQRPPIPLEAGQAGEDRVARLPAAARLGPEARALDHEFAVVLDRALGQLPSERRTAVILRDIQGLSTQAAAEVVGIRQLSFKSRLHRGRMELRALSATYLELEDL